MLTGNERAQLEGKINTKIDESMAELKDIQMSNLSINLQSTVRYQRGDSLNNFDAGDDQTVSGHNDAPARLDKNYIVRYKEVLNEAKS
tara:strand:- start:824 stop:1087 length:264 start_codon:yes stop_codon:yes gene_type:complete